MDGLALSRSREEATSLAERRSFAPGGQGAERQGKHGKPELRHEEYTVGWLCALICEFNAARMLLDNTHEPLPGARGDDNCYLLGCMNGHNIVIALAGKGTTAAAHTAANLLRSFPNIRFGLMVGIGGGVPSALSSDPRKDIRLGDVVVSEAEKSHGGVVQYDRGRMHDGGFVIQSHLNKPPTILSQAVGQLRSDHFFGDSEMTEYINDAANQSTQRSTLSDYRFPGTARDLLFNPDYPHAGGEDCSACSVGQLCRREPRQSNDPVVHYGLIGSSNTVMASAQSRDTLRSNWKVICFETEAAGLMDNFPCVVIRGISDYSDDHKHDDWQPYAAVVAAAYAKDLLRVIMAEQVDTMDMPVREVTRRLDGLQDEVQQGFSQTHGHVESLLEEQEQRKMAQALDWLCATDYGPLQTDNLEKQHPGTGQWLLESDELRRFLDEDRQTLLCTGIPGAGKTILASIVVHHLLTTFYHDSSIAIAYIYCSYQRSNDQSAHHMLASLLKQIILKRSSLPNDIKELHLRHRKQGTRPSVHEIATALQSVAATYSKTFIIIDALDECQNTDASLSRFLAEVVSLQKRANASILATSRFIPRNTDAFDGSPILQVRAHDADICKYVDGQMCQLSESVARCPELQDEIKAAVTKSANGMFLLAQFHVDSLVGEMSEKTTRAALERLPTGPGAIDKTYDLAMERVEAQIGKQPLLAKKVLAWLTCARRTLTTEELQHALATEVGESKLHENNLPQLKDLISVCRGLVTVDHESQVIRLAHYTTQEYFERTQKKWFPDAHDAITDVCATYLSFDIFASGRCADSCAIRLRLEDSPLYQYAAYNWGYHTCLSSGCSDSVIKFLQKSAQTEAASQVLFAKMHLRETLYSPYLRGRHMVSFNMALVDFRNSDPMKVTGLHLAAYFGVTGAVQILGDRMNINARDAEGRTPLSYAADSGRVRVVELLLERNADLHLPDENGKTPLIYAAQAGFQKTLQILVNHGANVNSTDECGRTPLVLAASMNYYPIIQILVDNSASIHPVDIFGNTCLKWAVFNNSPEAALVLLRKDEEATTYPGGWLAVINWVLERGHQSLLGVLIEQGLVHDSEAHTGHRRSAMLKAAGHGDEAAVKLLLAAGATVNLEGVAEVSPLSLAALNGHRDMVCLLLKKGARANQELEFGRTPLVFGVRSGNPGVVKVLLDHGANIEAEDHNQWTPLSHAIGNRDIAMARLLLENGANPDFMGTNRRSLLMSAAANGDQDMVNLLLKYDANIDSQDTKGRVALSYALRERRPEMAMLLLQKGTNCEARDDTGQTPLMQAVVEQQEETVRLLLDHGSQNDAQDFHGRTSLWHAAGQGNKSMVRLLENDAVLNVSDDDGYTPLARAIMGGHMDVAKLLLECHGDTIFIDAYYGHTFLAWASKNGDGAVVQALLRKGIGANFTSEDGQTPLCLAAGNGHIAVVRILLSSDAHPDAPDGLGQTPVLRAAKRGHHSIIEELLRFGANINTADRHGQMPLIQAAKEGHGRVVRLLLEHRAEVDTADGDSQTALLHAAKGGHNAVLQLLINNHANVNLADQNGRSPLSWAAMHGHDTTIEMLLHHGATADHRDRSLKTPLAIAAFMGHASTVQLLLGRDVDIESEDESGRRPLFWAVYWNSIETTRVLLANGADPRRLDRNHRTPLAWAVERGQETMVDLLLRHDETLVDQGEYRTPLLLRAARHGHAGVAQLLLDNGHDVDLIDLEHGGRSALWYAADGGHLEVVRLLLASNATIYLPDNDSRTPLARALAKGHRDVVDLLAGHTEGLNVEVSTSSLFDIRRRE